MARKNKNWLGTLAEYVEETEAPRNYWLWSGIFTIAAALQRRVWIPYGLDNVYPNLYLLIVAPAGERKGGPPTLAKKLLEAIQVPVAVDSSSKRSLTKELAEIATKEFFAYRGKQKTMASIAIVSKEMSSILAVDPKGMIEVLTDLYDSHDKWRYKTSEKGEDALYNVCVSCFIVTTQTWLMENLPKEAVGGGFTSRFAIVHDAEFYKSVPWPPEPPKPIFDKMVYDLVQMNNLVGPFDVPDESKEVFESWYRTIPKKKKDLKDKRMIAFLNRMHVIALKVAMALHVSYSDQLIITPDDMGRAIDLVDECIMSGSRALGGYGKAKLGADIENIEMHIRFLGTTWFKELLAAHYRDVSKQELEEIIETIEAKGKITKALHKEKQDWKITWVKESKNEKGNNKD